jgi:DNA adenine methylase
MSAILNNPANPIVPWMGGKRRLADRLIPLFPNHECYVEVFCGGAALFFLRPMPAQVEVINDINGELVNLYRVVQNHLEEFVRQFKWALSSRQVFKWCQL